VFVPSYTEAGRPYVKNLVRDKLTRGKTVMDEVPIFMGYN